MVANGLGVTLLPERTLALELRPDTGLVARPFKKPAPSRTLGLAWRLGAARAGEYRLLGQTLAAALAERSARG
jgi:LysR family hydrogen peroxide-inducible transcriptional activator